MNINEVKLLVFDWDGTLMDSVMHIVASLAGAIEQLELEPRATDELKNVIGLGMKEAIFSLYPDNATDAFAEQFTSAYRDYFFAADAPQSLFPGAEETLKVLNEAGYMLAVATSKSRHGLDRVLNETGLGNLFQTSRCADETRSKPDPMMLQEILHSLEVKPQYALMIGDTEYDLEMANHAGVHPVGVSYGVHSVERLSLHKPRHILNELGELPPWLEQARQAV